MEEEKIKEKESEHEESKVHESHVAHKAEHKNEPKITHKGEEDEPSLTLKQSTLWKGGTYILGVLLIISLFTGGFGFGSDGSSGGSAGTGNVIVPPDQVPPTTGSVKVSADDDPFIGDDNAPVTIIEFSDYQCPFCQRFWSQTLGQIKTEYIDTGKVKFVYRDFPLDSIHPFATPAAIAAECVRDAAGGSDEAYFEYHDKIFEGQGSLSDASLKQWAKDIGYDIDSCLDSQEFLDEVRKDLADAQAAGGRGTPYFVIIGSSGQGTPLSGAQPFGAFQQIIEAELAK